MGRWYKISVWGVEITKAEACRYAQERVYGVARLGVYGISKKMQWENVVGSPENLDKLIFGVPLSKDVAAHVLKVLGNSTAWHRVLIEGSPKVFSGYTTSLQLYYG